MRDWKTYIALFLSVTLSVCAAHAAACQLKVGWKTWPPYIYQEDGRFAGSEYELLMALSEATDCQMEFIEVPWLRGLQMIKHNQLDMLYGASRTAEREQFAQFSRAYRMDEFMLVTLHLDDQADSVWLAQWLASPNQAGRSKMLGVVRGYYYNELLSSTTPDPAIQEQLLLVGSSAQLHMLLAVDRIDGYLTEADIARQQQKTSKQPLQLLKINGQPAEPMHLMFSRGVPAAVIERFDAAIRDLAAAPAEAP